MHNLHSLEDLHPSLTKSATLLRRPGNWSKGSKKTPIQDREINVGNRNCFEFTEIFDPLPRPLLAEHGWRRGTIVPSRKKIFVSAPLGFSKSEPNPGVAATADLWPVFAWAITGSRITEQACRKESGWREQKATRGALNSRLLMLPAATG